MEVFSKGPGNFVRISGSSNYTDPNYTELTVCTGCQVTFKQKNEKNGGNFSKKKDKKRKKNEKQTKKMNFLEGIFIIFQEVMDGKQDIIKSKPC